MIQPKHPLLGAWPQDGLSAPLSSYSFFFFFFFFYLFLSALGLRCYVLAFFSCGEQVLLFIAVCGLLIAVASLVVEHGL